MRKRCSICRRWFTPHPHAGARQKVCSETECQRERHRRNCANARRKEKLEVASQRTREAVKAADGSVNWEAVRDRVGPEVAGVLQEVADTGRLRDAVLKIFGLPPHVSPIVGLRDAVFAKAKEKGAIFVDLTVAMQGDAFASTPPAAIHPRHAGRTQPPHPPIRGAPDP